MMPARRELTKRQLRQKLRLHHDGASAREIARTLGVARSTIQDNLARSHAAEISWPLPAESSDEVLEQRLFARSGVKPGRRRYSEPGLMVAGRPQATDFILSFGSGGANPRKQRPRLESQMFSIRLDSNPRQIAGS
jgi:transposase